MPTEKKQHTLKDAIRMCRSIGITLRKVEDEYQIKPKWVKSWSHTMVYFTTDVQDAIDTAEVMSSCS